MKDSTAKRAQTSIAELSRPNRAARECEHQYQNTNAATHPSVMCSLSHLV
jgi:hypothetical protein